MTSKRYLGIDIGGTTTKVAIVEFPSGKISSLTVFPTYLKSTLFFKDLFKNVDKILKREKVAGIGIGAPGPLDPFKGIILNPINVPALHNSKLSHILSGRYKLPVQLANDADCFTWGEVKAGVARGCKNVFGITLGTGFGTGLVIKGDLYQGSHGLSGEIWAVPYKDSNANESLSAAGLIRLHASVANFSPDDIARLAKNGNKKALNTWMKYGHDMARILMPALQLIDPEMVVIGGGISASYSFFEKALKTELRHILIPALANKINIKRTKNPATSGIVGAAALLTRI